MPDEITFNAEGEVIETPEAISEQEEYDLQQAELEAKGKGKAEGSAADTPEQKEARAKGWKPEADYTGSAPWVDAQTFLERGKHFNTNLQAKVTNLEAQLAKFKKTADAFQEFHKETLAAKDKEMQEAILTLRKQHKEAIREGDDDAAIAYEDRIDVLKDEQKKLKTAPVEEAPVIDPVLEEWANDGNEWFKTDRKLQNYAVQLSQELRANGEKLKGRAFLDKVSEMMREEFPQKFGNAKRQRSSPVESGSSSSSRAGGKTARDLPAVDRALMQQFIAEGWTTEKDYLESYFSR